MPRSWYAYMYSGILPKARAHNTQPGHHSMTISPRYRLPRRDLCSHVPLKEVTVLKASAVAASDRPDEIPNSVKSRQSWRVSSGSKSVKRVCMDIRIPWKQPTSAESVVDNRCSAAEHGCRISNSLSLSFSPHVYKVEYEDRRSGLAATG